MLAGLLLLCGIGLPLPEELILVSAGYVAYRGGLTGDGHHPVGLMATAAGAILVGDSIPYVLGRIFGPKLLRLRLVRSWISQEGLARFDRWFHRHGRLTIFVARFLPGIRVPAFFTAGSMNTSSLRFYLMDGLGVLVSAPLFVWLGYYFGADIT
ncbi:MAG: DedA family protein, partial [Planctomycetes bacterium]|nr:DedA family protein [Planctomycetota bacterium]